MQNIQKNIRNIVNRIELCYFCLVQSLFFAVDLLYNLIVIIFREGMIKIVK